MRESRERVRVAIRNSGFNYPSQRVLVNLAPADVPKAGNGFDLAIAVSIIACSQQIEDSDIGRMLVFGELHLDGSVSGVRGAISAVDEARRKGIRHFLVPRENLNESAVVADGRVAALSHLSDLRRLVVELNGGSATAASRPGTRPASRLAQRPGSRPSRHATAQCGHGDYVHLRGNALFKRVLTLAAAGGHHLLAVGPPGVGKSMGIGLLPTILPRLRREEALEVTRIHSLAGEPVPTGGLLSCRPFRAPHHNSSVEGLLGGGRSQRPGEISLAHRGVLFLDEALEFQRPALQGLREPLERGSVHISRAGRTFWFPARMQLIMAANPCPCGNLGRSDRHCLCSLSEVERYWRRLGSPLLDRMDLRVVVPLEDVSSLPLTDTSGQMAKSAKRARDRQLARDGVTSAELSVRQLSTVTLNEDARRMLERSCARLRLSGRASASIIRVARTIADVEGCELVDGDHVLEAVAHRRRGEDIPLWSP